MGSDAMWFAVDHLPVTGVKISVIVFGGLTLLTLGGGVFLASRRHHRPPPPVTPPHVLNGLTLNQRDRQGFDPGAHGHAIREGGEASRPAKGPEA